MEVEQQTTDPKHVGKRLWQYALQYKTSFIIALLMLILTVAAELSGPFIARNIIDKHILGIEQPYYETSAEAKGAIAYAERHFKRQDRFAEAEPKGKEVRILQIGRQFIFVDGSVPDLAGERRYDAGTLTIGTGETSWSSPATAMSLQQLLTFYQPEIIGIIQNMALYAGLLLVSVTMSYGQILGLQTAANRVIRKLRGDVYAHVQRLPIPYFDNLPAGKVVSRVTNDTEAVKELFVSVLESFTSGIITIAGIYVALFILDVKLAFICMFILPLIVLWVVLYRKFATKYNKIIRSRLSSINAMINESIQGIPVIRSFRRQKETMEEFESWNEEYLANQNKMLNLNALTSHNLVTVLRNIAFAVVLWYFGGASLSGSGIITIGVLYAFSDLLNRLFQPITGMVNQLANLDSSIVSAGRVFALMDEPGEALSEGSMPRYKGHVEFDQVSFAYKEEFVLKQISFEAKPGQTVALVGHTGSGKSSIMNLLFRFYDPQKGEVRIDGTPITSVPKQWIREHMGIVLQDPYLFTGTIASNVSLDDPRISRQQVEEALRAVGADRVLKGLPNGIDEPVVEKGSTLSAGQRQLISFARALAFQPAILILDEATANIDTETESIIQEALDVLKRGRTTFIIAHRLSTIRSADVILVLHRGEIVERGSHDELMALQGRYYKMYQLQQGAGTPDGTADVPGAQPSAAAQSAAVIVPSM
ncbi:ABC transporter ATP-binding protein [Paenibacillus apiarius]|uniref:ABC transporter ATP-binding protein/permease n=1 Tax=Paenibacillus apiarius TaxID=46240 RepID=A0ABT4DXM3_9BACL|nr:ABC transporter ATP-binding protein [Paenibacillus apiarius]MCY9512853.1 ABC transporter ATP-binding protein/permease [Paenibacillus apiarius]MCY9522098.1 ABC transporter ATP-binding protein/permease [Paenibacillus apiarius]MCY9554083.1 ABC transporter ATP-binding protein/permease [Paenibacillus apiarius]MCY9558858.1 ABC transporter ATP-binding protein/permease [Paenibacillus apiarius]MCY9683904.1 ABC transporter ATP-binding protein/permease [Paenibacillus apiarius]